MLTYLLALAIALLLYIVGARQRIAAAWIIVAIVSVCVLGGFHEVGLQPADEPGRDVLYVGFRLAPPYSELALGNDFFRGALNLLLMSAAHFLWRRSRAGTLRSKSETKLHIVGEYTG